MAQKPQVRRDTNLHHVIALRQHNGSPIRSNGGISEEVEPSPEGWGETGEGSGAAAVAGLGAARS